MTAFKSSLFKDIDSPARDTFSRVLLQQRSFQRQLCAVCLFISLSPKAVHSLRVAHDGLVPGLNSFSRQTQIANRLSVRLSVLK